jgi:hypothetical protein
MGKKTLSPAELLEKMAELQRQLEEGLPDEVAAAVVGLTDPAEVERVMREITDRWLAKFEAGVTALLSPPH